MDQHAAKLKSLEELIGMMDGQLLAPFRVKKEKAQATTTPSEVEIKVEAEPEMEAKEADGLDPEMLRKLADMYESDDLKPTDPIPAT